MFLYVARTSVSKKTATSKFEKPAGRMSRKERPTNIAKQANTADKAGLTPNNRPV